MAEIEMPSPDWRLDVYVVADGVYNDTMGKPEVYEAQLRPETKQAILEDLEIGVNMPQGMTQVVHLIVKFNDGQEYLED